MEKVTLFSLKKYGILCYEKLFKDTQPVYVFDKCIICTKRKDFAISYKNLKIFAERFLTCKLSYTTLTN